MDKHSEIYRPSVACSDIIILILLSLLEFLLHCCTYPTTCSWCWRWI